MVKKVVGKNLELEHTDWNVGGQLLMSSNSRRGTPGSVTKAIPRENQSLLPTPVGILLAVAYLVLATWFALYQLVPPPPPPCKTAIPPVAGDIVATGAVLGEHESLVSYPRITVTVFKAADQKLFEREVASNECGTFVIRTKDVAIDLAAYVVQVKATAAFHLAGQSDHVVTLREAPASGSDTQPKPKIPVFDQSQIRIYSPSLNPLLVVLLFLPGVFGLLFSVLHVAQLCPGMPFSAIYAAGNAYLWSLVSARLVYVFAYTGDTLIPLFWPGLLISSGVVVASFVGTLTYAAYSVFSKPIDFHRNAPADVRQKLLTTMGGRILVAPYLAIVALVVFGSTFPTLRTPPFELFLGFFTGLYITVVLKALNGLGTKLLSDAEQTRVAAKGTALVAPGATGDQTQSGGGQPPSPALFEAVEQARQQLLANHRTVIGVGAGIKQVDGVQTQAVTVYVLEKQEVPENPIPATVGNFPTAVRTPPPPEDGKPCHAAMLDISWEKVNQLNSARLGRTPVSPGAADVSRFPTADPRFLILTCSPTEILVGSEQSGNLFDIVSAFRSVVGQLSGSHEFVAFLLDTRSGLLDSRTNYYVPVFNEVQNIDFCRPGNPYDQRTAWGAYPRLRGCQVHALDVDAAPPLSHRVALHELGHAWSMYLRQVPGLADRFGQHWSPFADNGTSCMDNDQAVWLAGDSPGEFKRVHQTEDTAFGYSPLDLYLMGVRPSSSVKDIRVFSADLDVQDGVPFAATPKVITISDITAAYGERSPAPAGPAAHFRQAFVIVSASRSSGESCARKLMDLGFLDDHEALFRHATGGAAELSTRL